MRIGPSLLVTVMLLTSAGAKAAELREVTCEDTYPHHLQGVCLDSDVIYWCFTTKLVKTDRAGKVIKGVPVDNHHGDLCHDDGKIYVAVNLGKFHDAQGHADSWVYVYDSDDLSLLTRYATPEVFHGAGGIACHAGKFLVVGGLPQGGMENTAYEYNETFQFVRKHVLRSGHTLMGIQTAAFADGHWWFGCYGDPKILLRADESLQQIERFDFDCSLGIAPVGEGRFLIGRGTCSKEKGCTGRLVLASTDAERGLALQEAAAVTFQQDHGTLQIAIGGQPVADYVFADDKIRRPYFRHLRTLSGVQVTRTQPPEKGQDLDDHATMHPGLWLAFGDLSGHDFWRNKGTVRHVRFVAEPKSHTGRGTFTVRNIYESNEKPICTEDCEITIIVRPDGYLLDWRSTFRSETGEVAFGDQEEMGLGVRAATPLAVIKGGTIIDSEGRQNEPQIWGKQADWCRYTGVVDGERVGVALMPHPQNFRRSWFHARDYGVLVANPFGRRAFTSGETSRIVMPQGDEFRLRFGVLVYESPEGKSPDISAAYREYLQE